MVKKELSLYIHIPFCKSKCHYCDFISFPQRENDMSLYVDALEKEIEAYGKQCGEYNVKSIFLGGGTPSILPSADIKKIMNALWTSFHIDVHAEISIEANPGTLTEEKVAIFVESGVNRVSMGLQSCQNHLLKKLGRIHSFEIFLESYRLLRAGGISNINVDLIFGLPGQSLEDVKKDLEMMKLVNPEHLSCYGLIVEEGTVFHRLREEGKLTTVDEDIERKMYWYIHDQLTGYGYEHYEISNYGKPDRACYHNLAYWTCKSYIGMGLGASSYFQGKRYKNIDTLEDYIASYGDIHLLQKDVETIDQKMAVEEYMFLGLRLLDGINKEDFERRFNKDILYYYEDVITELVSQGLMEEDTYKVWLTRKGIDVSNRVFAEFLLT